MTTLVIGTGFIGSALAATLRSFGIDVVQSSRSHGRADVAIPHGAALDRHLQDNQYDQVVVVGQLTGPDIDWVIQRVDGRRWVILSSQQVTSAVASPGRDVALAREEVALGRGACVLRPTMVYGKGCDLNISRLIRFMSRWHIAVVPGSGDQLVQPIHVDDVASLIARHGCSPLSGLFALGGPEALPTRELVCTLCELVGVRTPPLGLSSRQLGLLQRLPAAFGMRPDQWRRLIESKTAVTEPTMAAFSWEPQPLGWRLEQAVREMHGQKIRIDPTKARPHDAADPPDTSNAQSGVPERGASMTGRKERGWWVFQHIPPAAQRLLDVGCYTASDTATWEPRASNLFGIDLDPAIRSGSRSFYRVQGSAAKLPFANATFDVVTFSEVLGHLPAELEREAIEEFRRVITDSGTLIMTTPHNGWFSWLDPLDVKRRLGLRSGKGHKHYAVAEVEKLLSGLFQLTELDRTLCLLHPISTWLGFGNQNRWVGLRGKLSDWDYQHHFGRASFNMALTAKPI